MDIAVTAGGRCTDGGMPEHAAAPASTHLTRVDLSGATWVDPMGLVVIATVLSRAAERGSPVEFVAPADPEVAGYLTRMRLGALLDTWEVPHALDGTGAASAGDRLVELTRFSGQIDADTLALRVHGIFAPVDPVVARALAAALQEVTSNVLVHSRRRHGFLALQQYVVDGEQQVAFAVGDCGVGLRATVSRRHPCDTDARALDLAVQRRVSGSGPDAGLGLSSVVAIASRRGGDVRLWSGSAFGVVTSPGGSSAQRRPRGHLDGTVIHARMRVRREDGADDQDARRPAAVRRASQGPRPA